MKTNLKFFFSFLVFGLLLVNSGYSQTAPEFNFSTLATPEGTLGNIVLDVDSPLNEKYTVTISTLNWTEDDANNLTNYLNNQSDLFNLEVDYGNDKILLTLDITTPQTINWNLQEWNSYFESIQ